MANKEVTDIPLDPVTEGLISENILSHYVVPKGAISYVENMHNDVLGQMVTRKSFVVTATSPAARALGCVLYTLTAGGSSGTVSIVWQEGTTIKVQDLLGTGAVTSYTSATGSAKQRYDICQGKLLITNGGAQPKYFDGTGAPAGLGTSFPNAVNVISAGFSGRIWTADSTAFTNKLYYSDVIPSTGVVDTVGGASFLTVNANNGDKITGFARTQNVLYVFTNNGIFRCYNTQSLDNTSIANVGAFNQEAIVKGKNGYYFYHPSGIYYIGSNGFPQEVSAKIRDIIQKIPNAYQSSVFGWSDDDHVYFNVGTLSTVSSTKQFILRYTMSTQVWSIYALNSSSGSLAITCAASENFASTSITSNDIYPANFVFADDGVSYYKGTFNIFDQATSNSSVSNDFGAFPVYAEYQTHWLDFDIENHVKRVNGLAIPHQNASGWKVAWQSDKDRPNVWRDIGELDGNYITYFRDMQSDKFFRIKLRVYGETKGVEIKIGRPIFIQVDDLGYDVN